MGVLTSKENVGEVENSGVELQNKSNSNFKNKDWQWSLSLNYSYNKNKIKKISNALKGDKTSRIRRKVALYLYPFMKKDNR